MFLNIEYYFRADPDIEIVTTSGYGKNGALCVLQRSVRPQVVTTFELPGCQDMWTVVGDTAGGGEGGSGLPDGHGHSFLILSRADSTMILQTGQEINELESSGFHTDGPTVFCGNITATAIDGGKSNSSSSNNNYIVQVRVPCSKARE